MAGNNNNNISNSRSFTRLLEEGFEEEDLMSDFSGTNRENGQNSSMDLSGEPRGQLGFGEPIPRAQQPTPRKLKANIASSTPSLLNSPQSLPWSLDNNSGSTSSNDNNIHQLSATDLLLAVSISSEENTPKIAKLALEAMEELRRLALEPGEPLWKLDLDRNIQTLNAFEYTKHTGDTNATMIEINRLTKFNSHEKSKRLWPKNYSGRDNGVNDEFFESLTSDLLVDNNRNNNRSPQDHLYTEGSRDIGYVGMKPLEIVELLMNLEKWSQVFFDIVSKTSVLGVLASSGVQGNYEDTLQVLKAEFQFPGPLVPSRKSYMARFCKRLGQGLWGVADVSLENLFEFSYSRHFRRCPSGCLIEQMPNGFSKVTWVENVAVDNSKKYGIFQQMVNCGFAFSAKRWVETMARYCERSSSPSLTTLVNPFADTVLSVHEIGKRSVLKLSERIVKRFLCDISGSTTNKWIDLSQIPNDKDPMLMATKTYKGDPGKPSGLSTYFATSLGLQTPPNKLFDFLRDGKSRPMWDFMCFGRHSIHEVLRVKTSADPTNYVSLIQVKSSPSTVANFYLQETHTNSLGSYVIYSPLEPWSTSMILSGGDPEIVEILPSGFVIHSNGGVENNESILTVALHFIDQVAIRGITPRSVESMNNILDNSIISIKNAVLPNYYISENHGTVESNKRMRKN